MTLIFSDMSYANSKNADSIALWLEDTYSISSATLQAYRGSLPKKDARRQKLESEAILSEIKKNSQSKLSKKLEAEFSKTEIKYLNDLFHHELLVRFEKFRKNIYDVQIVKDVIEKK